MLPLVSLWRLLIAYHYSMTLALGVEVVVLHVSLIRWNTVTIIHIAMVLIRWNQILYLQSCSFFDNLVLFGCTRAGACTKSDSSRHFIQSLLLAIIFGSRLWWCPAHFNASKRKPLHCIVYYCDRVILNLIFTQSDISRWGHNIFATDRITYIIRSSSAVELLLQIPLTRDGWSLEGRLWEVHVMHLLHVWLVHKMSADRVPLIDNLLFQLYRSGNLVFVGIVMRWDVCQGVHSGGEVHELWIADDRVRIKCIDVLVQRFVRLLRRCSHLLIDLILLSSRSGLLVKFLLWLVL